MSGRTFNVLFLCTGNSARSILAECLLRQLGKGLFRVFSAGSFLKGKIPPLAAASGGTGACPRKVCARNPGMSCQRRGTRHAGHGFLYSQSDQAASEVCPVWPGQPVTEHRGIIDPAPVDGSEAERMLTFPEAFRALEQRLKISVGLLIDEPDCITLIRQVVAIGRLRGDAVEEHAP